MTTPIYDFVKKYAESTNVRLHMPGHKGRGAQGTFLETASPMDITEIAGADSLFEADGIIAESEANAAQLYGTEKTLFSAGGSTLCIQAMLALMKQEGRRAVAVRNAHRAFLAACVLLDIEIEWSYPYYTNSIISAGVSVAEIEKTLSAQNAPCFVYITSPDYFGRMSDIRAISELCGKYNAPLLVDNAHGAHLAFMPENLHPIALGADMCCDSAHKMLPALTGAAYLHIGNAAYSERAKGAMSLFASTSPSYLIMESLDLCNVYLSDRIRDDLKRVTERICALKSKFESIFTFCDGEPLHLTIYTIYNGIYGNDFADILRSYGIECEYADREAVVLLFSPLSDDEDFERLENALKSIRQLKIRLESEPIVFPRLECCMNMREAALCAYEEIPVEAAEGRICAAVKVPCPPAVPIAVSGERITAECINIYKRYGILSVNVVK